MKKILLLAFNIFICLEFPFLTNSHEIIIEQTINSLSGNPYYTYQHHDLLLFSLNRVVSFLVIFEEERDCGNAIILRITVH